MNMPPVSLTHSPAADLPSWCAWLPLLILLIGAVVIFGHTKADVQKKTDGSLGPKPGPWLLFLMCYKCCCSWICSVQWLSFSYLLFICHKTCQDGPENILVSLALAQAFSFFMEQAGVFYFQNLVFMAHICFLILKVLPWSHSIQRVRKKNGMDKHCTISGLAFLRRFFQDAPLTLAQSLN